MGGIRLGCDFHLAPLFAAARPLAGGRSGGTDIDLAHWVFEEFRIATSKQTLSRELRAMGLRKLSARPQHHAQDTEASQSPLKSDSNDSSFRLGPAGPFAARISSDLGAGLAVLNK